MDQKDVPIPHSLIERLRKATAVTVLTGAGVSAESGVPTYRDAQVGLWARFDPLQLATPEAFTREPKRVWEWYAWRRQLIAGARPNAGHEALVDLERRVPEFLLATQNVDGLHAQAGSRRLVELHGNLRRTVCSRDRQVIERWSDEQVPPRCPECGAPLRPDVVWFGEDLPGEALAAARQAAARCQVFLSIGTASEVYPAAALPEIAKQSGATVVEINPRPTPLSADADFVLRGPAARVVPALVSSVAGPEAARRKPRC